MFKGRCHGEGKKDQCEGRCSGFKGTEGWAIQQGFENGGRERAESEGVGQDKEVEVDLRPEPLILRIRRGHATGL